MIPRGENRTDRKEKRGDVAMKLNILYILDSKGLKFCARRAEAAISIGSSVAIFRSAY